MAEGLLNSLFENKYAAFSAGTEPTIVNPHAIQVMSELGIDISKHRSKSINTFIEQKFDYVITVCDHAREACPAFPGGKKLMHHSFVDPASVTGTEQERQAVFRKTRDEIKDWIEKEFG